MADKKSAVQRFRTHLTYSWIKYLIVLVVSVMGVDVLFAMTAPRVPQEEKIELYICNDTVDTETIQKDFFPLMQKRFSDQRELTVMNINLSIDDMYASMQFATYAAAQQGDVCLMPRSEFDKLTVDGADSAFLELTPYIEQNIIDTAGIDLTAGMRQSETGEMGLYAIPADSLYGFMNYGNDPTDSFLCVMAYSTNQDTAAGMIDLMIEQLSIEKPQAADGAQRMQSESVQLFA